MDIIPKSLWAVRGIWALLPPLIYLKWRNNLAVRKKEMRSERNLPEQDTKKVLLAATSTTGPPQPLAASPASSTQLPENLCLPSLPAAWQPPARSSPRTPKKRGKNRADAVCLRCLKGWPCTGSCQWNRAAGGRKQNGKPKICFYYSAEVLEAGTESRIHRTPAKIPCTTSFLFFFFLKGNSAAVFLDTLWKKKVPNCYFYWGWLL